MNTKLTIILCIVSGIINAQLPHIQYMRPTDQSGLNVFEDIKNDTIPYGGLKVRVGGDFTIQFQGLNQSNDEDSLVELGTNFNLPSANLNLNVQLLDGVRMHIRTYLSSRHHNEAWIKGGHVTIDKLDFIRPGFLKEIMQYTTINVGLDEFNYGDAHFRRSDNARTIFNPFIGNYIMDAFSTEAFGELTIQAKSLIAVLGLTNGKLNQSVVVNDKSDNKPSFYGKIGFDKQTSDDLRLRLTGSWYINKGTTSGTWLYGGDRAGARYYDVLHTIPDAEGNTKGTDFDGRFNAGFTKMSAFQINPFVKFKGLEFFGIYEISNGNNEITTPIEGKEGSFTQLAGELLFRFGQEDKFYLGARYNSIKGKMLDNDANELKIERYNVGGGWYLSKNILAKIEYVNQEYKGNAWTDRFAGAKFNGVNLEAGISF